MVRWVGIFVFVLLSCAHQKTRPLKFYHIAKDIQHGADFAGDTVDHDLHIPPQIKNIAIVISQRHSHYRELSYGFKVFLRQQADRGPFTFANIAWQTSNCPLGPVPCINVKCMVLLLICHVPRCVIS